MDGELRDVVERFVWDGLSFLKRGKGKGKLAGPSNVERTCIFLARLLRLIPSGNMYLGVAWPTARKTPAKYLALTTSLGVPFGHRLALASLRMKER